MYRTGILSHGQPVTNFIVDPYSLLNHIAMVDIEQIADSIRPKQEYAPDDGKPLCQIIFNARDIKDLHERKALIQSCIEIEKKNNTEWRSVWCIENAIILDGKIEVLRIQVPITNTTNLIGYHKNLSRKTVNQCEDELRKITDLLKITDFLKRYESVKGENSRRHFRLTSTPNYPAHIKLHQYYTNEEYKQIVDAAVKIVDAAPTCEESKALSITEDAQNDFTKSSIQDYLVEFEGSMNAADYGILVAALKEYFETGQFPKLAKTIRVSGDVAVKDLGRKLHDMLKALHPKNVKLGKAPEYLKFAKENISLFADATFDENNIYKSNLYKYFTP